MVCLDILQENEGEGNLVEEFEIEYDADEVPEGAEGTEGTEGENSGEGSAMKVCRYDQLHVVNLLFNSLNPYVF